MERKGVQQGPVPLSSPEEPPEAAEGWAPAQKGAHVPGR